MNKGKVGIIIQARMSSKRLPGKVLLPILGKPILLHTIERCKLVKNKDCVVVATSLDKSDDILVKICEANNVLFYRDFLEDVYSRFVNCAEFYGIKTIVRITADCPFVYTPLIEHAIDAYKTGNYDLVYIEPDGLSCEVFSLDLLKKSKEQIKKYSLEHFTMYFYSREAKDNGIKIYSIKNPLEGIKLSVDTSDDYFFAKTLAEVIHNYI